MVIYIFNKDDSNVEIQAVKKAIRENKSLRMHKIYIVIIHHLKGYLNCEIAEMELLWGNTVGTYVNNYKKYGLDGLVIDNARIHHAKLVQPFLEQNKSRLNLIFFHHIVQTLTW